MKVHTLILPCHLTTHNRSQSSFSTLSLSHHQSKMWVANLTWFPLPLTLGWLDQLPHLGLIDGGWECQHGAEASPEHTHTHVPWQTMYVTAHNPPPPQEPGRTHVCVRLQSKGAGVRGADGELHNPPQHNAGLPLKNMIYYIQIWGRIWMTFVYRYR